ncbi:uncharacterized protein BDV17DRAFT_275337 [Aspergillus undulatus]|uniref:uncharacterized protein n=1 Tax=Aspergillus undulatus TaxID=1810928 RepID=UPI003CCDBDF1
MTGMHTATHHESHELLLTHHKPLSTSATGEEKAEPKQSRLRRWWSGWKFALFLASTACVFVLAFNLGFLLWAVARDSLKSERGVLYEGDCDRVSRLSTGLHLVINIFSTLLLSASNYGMQCLCAPTRKDVDRVHQQGGWLNIGVPSIRNLSHVSRRRLLMWICLLLSSVPLHLLYNSTIFSTISAYGYDVFVGRETPDGKRLEELDLDGQDIPFSRLYETAQNGTLESLTATECFDAYGITYQTKYGGVIILSDDAETTTRYDWITYEDVYTPAWSSPNLWLSSFAGQGDWKVGDGYRVKSCLSERVPQHCKLQYSLPLTITVIVSNLVKAIVLCYMSFRKAEPPLLTTGDAVASFLHKPDPVSMGRCLLSETNCRDSADSTDRHLYRPLAFVDKRRGWFSAVPLREWLSLVLLWGVAIGVCIFLILLGQHNGGVEIWEAKFGTSSSQVHSSTLIKGEGWPTSLIANTIIANTPQLIFSLLYFVLNSILTAMTLAAEWSRYARTRRGLRVSWNPQSAQRRTYFLSLPYRYAMPLIASCATLHWLISQSLFLVGVDAYDGQWERIERLDVMTCGYNPIAIVSSISVGVAMLLCAAALSCRRLDSSMVVAGSCSLAIAAACHTKYDPNLNLEDEGQRIQSLTAEDMEYLPLQWGSVSVDGELGHCTFTSERVEMPEAGRLYL